jgi:hypothetical protein
LGEESESYLLRVFQGSAIKREVTLDTPQWTYTVADQAADGVGSAFEISVAQESAVFGAGPDRRVQVDA